MSKHRNYSAFYNKPQAEESTHETVEEVQAVKEATETVKEEAPVEEPKVEEVQEPARKFAVIGGADKVNLRQQPDTSGKIIKAFPKGTEVEVLETVNKSWAKIAIKEQIGYMMSQYLMRVK